MQSQHCASKEGENIAKSLPMCPRETLSHPQIWKAVYSQILRPKGTIVILQSVIVPHRASPKIIPRANLLDKHLILI